jgi:hypothetical protein
MTKVYSEGDTILILDTIPSVGGAGGEDTINEYEHTMTGSETLNPPSEGIRFVCILDPGGADRNYNPNAGFPAGFEVVIVNKGDELITFDSATLAAPVAPGEKKAFYFNGTVWF